MFGRFMLDPITCNLLRDGVRLPLSDRLFATLLYFVEHHGRVIERGELLQAIWPGRSVEDGNLPRAISSLRTALKDQEEGGNLIITVPGRGYRFGEHVVFEPAAFRSQGYAEQQLPDHNDDTDAPGWRGHDEPWRSRTIGRRQLWVALITAACAACLAVYLSAWRSAKVSSSAWPLAAPERSIAVLPFVNRSHSDQLDVLADGLSEELINALGGIASLHVAASRSSFSFKGKVQTIGDIARALNVRTVLEGSIQQDAAATHVTAQLIDAATGYQLWSRDYDGDAGKVLPLERNIADAVAKSLKIVLVGDDVADVTLGSTANGEAFNAYLRGMAALRASRDNANPDAIAAFGDAIRIDPTYARAYARRARALAYRYVSTVFPSAASQQQTLIQARADADKAVALAPGLGASHAALADVIRFGLSDMAVADAEIKRALALSPNDTDVLLDYAAMAVDSGHFADAVAAANRATLLDPLSPLTYLHLASVLANARHFDLATAALDHAKALSDGVLAADYGLHGFIRILTDQPGAAREICAGKRNFYDLACLAMADHALGLQQEAEAALAQLHTALGPSGAYTYAHIAAAWGRPDEAQRWLRTAYTLKDPGLVFMKVDPALEPIHATPVFQDIQARLGFSN